MYTGLRIQGSDGAEGSSSPFHTKCVQYQHPPVFKGGGELKTMILIIQFIGNKAMIIISMSAKEQ